MAGYRGNLPEAPSLFMAISVGVPIASQNSFIITAHAILLFSEHLKVLCLGVIDRIPVVSTDEKVFKRNAE